MIKRLACVISLWWLFSQPLYAKPSFNFQQNYPRYIEALKQPASLQTLIQQNPTQARGLFEELLVDGVITHYSEFTHNPQRHQLLKQLAQKSGDAVLTQQAEHFERYLKGETVYTEQSQGLEQILYLMLRAHQETNQAQIQTVNAYMRLCTAQANAHCLAEGIHFRGWQATTSKDYIQAKTLFEESAQRYATLNNWMGVAFNRAAIGNVYYEQNQPRPANQAYQQALDLTKKYQLPLEESELLMDWGWQYEKRGEWSPAFRYYQQALNLAQAKALKGQERKALASLANAHYENEDYVKAIDYYRQALKRAEDLEHKTLEPTYLSNMALASQKLKKYQPALHYMKDALKRLEALPNQSRKPLYLNGIGDIYHDLKQYREALPYFEQALTSAKHYQNAEEIRFQHGSIGHIHTHLEQPQAALPHYLEALKLARVQTDRNLIIYYEGEVGKNYYALKKYAEAAQYLRQALKEAKTHSDSATQQELAENLGLTYRAQQEYPSAAIYFEEATQLAETQANTNAAYNYLILLVDVYGAMGFESEARHALERAKKLETAS